MKRHLLKTPLLLQSEVLWGYYPTPVKYGIVKEQIRFYHKNRLLNGLRLPWEGEDFWTKLCYLWWDGRRGTVSGLGDWTGYWIPPETIGEIYNTLFADTGRHYEPPMSNVPSATYIDQPGFQLTVEGPPIPYSLQEIHSILRLE